MSNFYVFLAPFLIIIVSSQFDYAEYEKVGFIFLGIRISILSLNNLNRVRNQKILLSTRFDRDQLFHVLRVLISRKKFYFQNFSVLNLVFA